MLDKCSTELYPQLSGCTFGFLKFQHMFSYIFSSGLDSGVLESVGWCASLVVNSYCLSSLLCAVLHYISLAA